MNHTLLSPKQAAQHFNVSTQTLRDWANDGKIECVVTRGGHRRYKIKNNPKDDRKKIIYARVSSKKQEEDLNRQIAFLKRKYPNHEVKSDIGSGINHKRTEFLWILEQLFEGNIEEVVVASSDRFSRLGKEFFEWLFEKFESKLISVQETKFRSPSEELADDLMEIITVFSARYHGIRKYNL